MKTDWFPDNTTPVHEGLYETRVDGRFLTWSIWKDGFWHFASTDREECVKMAAQGSKSYWQVREWRGATEQAK
jgi:hypothetical protein